MNESLSSALEKLPQQQPCIIVDGRQITVGQLLSRAKHLNGKRGLDSHTRLGLHGLTPLDLLVALLAFDSQVEAMLLLPDYLNSDIVSSLVNKARCQVVLTPDLQPKDLPHQHQTFYSNKYSTTDWLLATSGTTGHPKLIEHSLASLTRTVRRNMIVGQKLIWGLAYDPCRFAGLQVLLQSLLGGSILVFSASNSFDDQIRSWITAKINALSATPSLWRKLLMDGRIKALNLQQITLGGEIADQPIIDSLHQTYPEARVIHIYASTEAGTGFTVKDGKAGFPTDWLESSASGVQLKISDQGHLLIKPDVLPNGDTIHNRLLPDGYLDTEDLVSIQGDRVIFIGRASGAINVGGNKVCPEQVENCLMQVQGIMDARVYGKSNSLMGQLVSADLTVLPNTDLVTLREKLVQHCRQHLETWQRPMLINFVDSIKINSAGKKERFIK